MLVHPAKKKFVFANRWLTQTTTGLCVLDKKIVCRVGALFKLAATIEKSVEVATARAEKLTQAILAKAFRGELVPTEAELARREGRSYESAVDLLARIRSAGGPNGNGSKPRKQRNKRK
jgi:type I restriction enzyme, S subunit